mgnify:CR=1 FL=1
MILTCPKCDTQYFADDSTIGESGRTVKCAACGHSWFVAPPGLEPEKARSNPVAAHEVYRERVREQRRRKSRTAALLSWLVTAVLFFVLGVAAIMFRNDVVKVFPRAAGAYKMAGFTVNPAVMVTLQAFVKQELGRDSGDAAQVFAAMGVGIAISSVVVMRKGNMANKGAAFQRALMVGSTMTFLMGLTTEYWQLFPLAFCMGLAGGFYINMNQGLIQANTPQPLMGRVMGLYTLVQVGLMPIGALILGVIANSFGIGNTISAAAAMAFVVVVTTYVMGRELRTLS